MTMITVDENKQINLEDVTKAYRGRDEGCRCGCAGNYFYANSEDEKEVATLKRIVNKINKNLYAVNGYTETYVNLSLKNNRALTVYFG